MNNPIVQIIQLDNAEWLNPDVHSYTLSDTNDIWRISIDNNLIHINKYWNLLSADEHERAQKYYREKDKNRFIISRAALRILLSRYLKLKPPNIEFEIGDNQKPHVKGHDIFYNVSHSGNYILIALAAVAVGIDVEQVDGNMRFEDIMNIAYSNPEIDLVNSSTNPALTFYILWTRKEALLKATARGIDDGLRLIPSIDGDHNSTFSIKGSNQSWMVQSFNVDHEHVGSIASSSENLSLRNFEK